MHSGWQDAAWKYAHSKERRRLLILMAVMVVFLGALYAFVVCRRPSRCVSMFRVGAGGVSKLGDGHVGRNAQVVAVNAETHNFCFPLKDFGGHLSCRL